MAEAVHHGPALGLVAPLVLVVADAAALSLWLAGRLTTPQILLAHVVLTALCLCPALLLRRDRLTPATVEGGLCAIAGPLGGIVLLLIRLGQPRSDGSTPPVDDLLDEELDEIQPLPELIYEMHQEGRRWVAQELGRQSYADIFRADELPRHNEAIAAISRNYEPAMYPALSLALGSSSPALKVQAAAVYSKLRRSFGETAKELLAIDPAGLAPEDLIAHHGDLVRAAQSGFVDAARSEALAARATALEAAGLPVGARPGARARKAYGLVTDVRRKGPRFKRYSCGGLG